MTSIRVARISIRVAEVDKIRRQNNTIKAIITLSEVSKTQWNT